MCSKVLEIGFKIWEMAWKVWEICLKPPQKPLKNITRTTREICEVLQGASKTKFKSCKNKLSVFQNPQISLEATKEYHQDYQGNLRGHEVLQVASKTKLKSFKKILSSVSKIHRSLQKPLKNITRTTREIREVLQGASITNSSHNNIQRSSKAPVTASWTIWTIA